MIHPSTNKRWAIENISTKVLNLYCNMMYCDLAESVRSWEH